MTMAAQVNFTYDQAFDNPDSNDLNPFFLNSDIAEKCTSDPNDVMQLSRSENRAFVNDYPDNVLDPWNEFGDLTCSLAQENLHGLDSLGYNANGDSTAQDDWREALNADFDLSMFQADDQSFDSLLSRHPAELSKSWEGSVTDTTISNAVPINLDNSCQPTPDLTECSTPASFCASNGFRAPTVGSVTSFDTENKRWHAMLSRSRAADCYFLYGVLTTKIFCRPSCASRRPSKRHVRFFPFPGAIEAAEQAKFRPCKRCKPEALGTGNTRVLAISQLLRRITAEAFEKRCEVKEEGLKLESLAKSAGLSTFHFHRLFKATTQVTPADFITACHALALQDSLCAYSTRVNRPDPRVVQLSPRWSDRTARKALGGLSPEDYANGAEATSVEYCRVSAPVGDLEVAYSRDSKRPNMTVHTVVLLRHSSLQIGNHFRTSKISEQHSKRLEQCVRELEKKCQDRDVELASDVLSVLWRARLWLKLTRDNVLGW